MYHIDPKENLIKESNIWNLAVIDNIDFKASTFSYDNIFDIIWQTSHVTLRMLFQFTILTSSDNLIKDHESINQPLFGTSSTTNNLLIMYKNIFNIILETHINEFDIEDICSEIIKQIPINCNTSPPNVVILESDDTPNCNENVHAACEMYHNNLPYGSDNYLYITCDQAIFRRLIFYKETYEDVWFLLK